MAHDTNPPCGVGTADAWFRFTVQTRDVVYADTRGSIGDTILAIYRSCTTPYAQSQIGEVVCSDDAMGSGCSPTPLSQVVAVLDPGAYYLLVSTRAGTPAGSATVHFQHLQAPVYDHWAPRGYATSRSLQPGPSMYQGVCAPGFTGEDMYWWTTCLVSPQNTVTVNVCANGGADPVLLLLAGAAGGGGVVTCRDNGGGCSAQSPGTVFGQQLPGLNAALVDGNNPGSYTIDINQ